MNNKIYFQDCPVLYKGDLNNKTVVDSVFESAITRKRFVVRDESDCNYCLVRVEKPVKSTRDRMTFYEIRVYNKDYKLMFSRQTNAKKWDNYLQAGIDRVISDIARLDKLVSLDKIDGYKMRYKSVISECVSKSLDRLKEVKETDITDFNTLLVVRDWCSLPSEDDLSDSDFKWFFDLYEGEEKIEKAVREKLTEMGFVVSGYLSLTPCGVMDYLGDKLYDYCIDKTIDSVRKRIDSLSSVDSLDSLTDSFFKTDWVRLALERLGGKNRVINELVKPRVKEIAEEEIQAIQKRIEYLESEIADNQASIEKYQKYLS